MSDYIPEGGCFLWNPTLIALHTVSDLAMVFAYVAIPFVLWRGILTDIAGKGPLRSFSWWLIAFMLGCGLTHLADVIVIWTPRYWTSGALNALTAVVSFGALRSLVVCLWKLERANAFARVRLALRELAEVQA